MNALAALIAAIALFAEAEPAAAGERAARPPEGSDAANAARAEAGLLPRKRPGRARAVRLGAEVVPAAASMPVSPSASPAPEPRGWLAVMLDAASALEPGGAPDAAPATSIEDVRARALGLRVEGRLTVRAGGVLLGAASSSEEPRPTVRAARPGAAASASATPVPAGSDAP